jgi:hypothetical protein
MARTSTDPSKVNEHWYKTPWGIGLISAFATVIAAVIGLVGVQLERSTQSSTRVTQPVRTIAPTTVSVPTETTGIDATETTSATIVGGNSTSVLLWHRKLHMPNGSSLDIDRDRPQVKPGFEPLVDLTVGSWRDGKAGFSLEGGRAGRLPSWEPTFAACLDALDTNALENGFRMRAGEAFCVESSSEQGPHRAAVRVLAWDEESAEADLEVIVWADTSPR